MSKFINASEAANLIKDNSFLLLSGFVGIGIPEEILFEMEKSFLEKNTPKNLTIMFAAGFGDSKTQGLNRFGHKGMLKKAIGGHWGLGPAIGKLANNNDIEAYNLPQGVVAQMFRDMAAKKPGTISHVGLGTFVDPDLQGGKLNSVTQDDIVEKIKLNGREVLFFHGQKGDVAILKGTSADEEGNISCEEEPLTGEKLSIATAIRNAGGKVIVQVKKRVKTGTIQPHDVIIPGIMVDYIVVSEVPEYNKQTYIHDFNPDYVSRKITSEIIEQSIVPFDERKMISRRCAMLLSRDKTVLNYGIGMPEVIAKVLNEEGQEEYFVPTVEPGVIGGTPEGGLNFGASINPACIIDQASQFDFYDGGGLDMAFLGLAQCDQFGNINVSKFGTKIAGCGGFINITQNAKEVVFLGTFTANGLKVDVDNGKLKILSEGKIKKFINNVEQITFSGNVAKENNKKVIYVTERAVFQLKKEGLTLIEIAPGVDLEKDILNQMEFIPIISNELKLMDSRIFSKEKMGLIL
ncbi:acyl CoA:acetate/3-ketoacid CoA transferase [Fusobacterium sp. PH5-44]|uniref:acyl CoA:acetate/3-ketoacid CoA transferase n=1 Tax=unclassified Fusobacterium TaxID=2648384 RepID=UPI003D1F6A94